MKKFNLNKISVVLVSCILNLVFVSFAIASGGAGEETPLWKDYMWKIINFGVLAFILFKFAKKPLQSFLKQRTDLIEKTLKEAREAKEIAQKALHEAEERLKTKDKEIEEILSAAKRSGEQEREKIIEESNKLKEKIFEQEKAIIEYR